MTKAEIIQGLKKAMTICDSVYAYDMDKYIAEAIKALEQEPTTKNDLGVDCISRQAVLDAIDSKAWEFCDYLISKGRNDEQKPVSHFADNLRECVREELPSVTPQETRWIPVKFRPLTDEEQDEYPDYCYMADCPMPDDGEEILVCTAHGGVEKDECGFEDGFYLDSGYDWQIDIVAWMPLPTPYEPQESEDKE